jgi:cell fate regulator YaaT (PSP1 superfamily)
MMKGHYIMILIIGVRFRKSGKVYYFDPEKRSIKKGDHVIVETARGIEYGTVVLPPKEVADDKVVQPLKPVIRIASPADDAINADNEAREKEAFQICLEKIAKHGLEMKLIDSEYTFDRNKLLFYFTADGRIDFRELVKDLASVFRTRIELRQIGVRDETKMIGGIAICGRPLCCHSYLSDFAPVSIKMAKEQNLSLNPSKISGACGRLMCCLKNEQEAYEYLNSTLPHIGAKVKTVEGYQGEVQSISVLKQRVKVLILHDDDEKEVREYHVSELQFENGSRPANATVATALPDEELDESELRELEALEKEVLEETNVEETPAAAKPRYENRKRPNYNKNSRPYNKENKRDNSSLTGEEENKKYRKRSYNSHGQNQNSHNSQYPSNNRTNKNGYRSNNKNFNKSNKNRTQG